MQFRVNGLMQFRVKKSAPQPKSFTPAPKIWVPYKKARRFAWLFCFLTLNRNELDLSTHNSTRCKINRLDFAVWYGLGSEYDLDTQGFALRNGRRKNKSPHFSMRAFELVPVFMDCGKYTLQWPNRLATRHPLFPHRLLARHPRGF
jgi:hypothetical protein